MKKILLAAVAAIAILSSCKKDEFIYYGSVETGNFVGGTFHADSGLKLTIRENLSEVDITTLERAIILCDIYGPKNASNTYEIRLRSYAEMALIEPLLRSEVEAEREYYTDPLALKTFWRSGGYINFGLEFLSRKGSTAKHSFYIVRDDTHHIDDTLRIRLEHFADGEYPGAESFVTETADQAACYISMSTTGLVPENSEKIPFKLTIPIYNYDIYGNVIEGGEVKEFKGSL